MLGIVGDNGKIVLSCGYSYQNVKVADSDTLTCKAVTQFCIVINPIDKRQ